MDWLLQRRFQFLLTALLFLLVGYPLVRTFHEGGMLFNGIITVIFIASSVVLFKRPSLRLTALLLGLPTLLSLWTGYVLPGLPRGPLTLGFHAIGAGFLAYTVGVILHGIARESSISADHAYGAFCGYVLIGLAFGHLYCIIEVAQPGSFLMEGKTLPSLLDESHTHFLLCYFSLVTLTTVGYGDMTPAHELARGLAIIEAITGQFYLAVFIAELIGKKASQKNGKDSP